MHNVEDLDLIFLIDRSGSMYGSEEDTIGGFNSFIEKEKLKEGNTRVTTILFDHEYEMLYKRKDIDDVNKLTRDEYYVRGSTALLDAIGKTITTLDREIDNKALFVITTDGMENSSVEFSKSQIKSMIQNHNWEFIFIGADIDSYSEARQLGIKKSRVANYDKSARGVEKMYSSIDFASTSMRENVSLDDVNWKKDLEEFD
ncbi:MAG: vWA domain-containing protein [Methanobrevibacter sp.]|uniref:vWA domain-containing protein n=1 Tax=Methanobrevibacter sp. TaxID=66852 RepID=UPI001DCD4CB2|nr:vWA domain-containing protein [Methanobrevibacter sp.]MBE6489565.1 VWA domain-containing protein [Methanobrevibacter sp.]MEE0902241.1 vWA domain-containing protein [Methanobrevibacter sp.]MEE0935473.1 vWA domain-containing protein [Methanobrevibacter sp.]